MPGTPDTMETVALHEARRVERRQEKTGETEESAFTLCPLYLVREKRTCGHREALCAERERESKQVEREKEVALTYK